ncbi:VanZ family protein [Peribacillus simplex]|uniref:VanZ family protein n=1 Tax=Peribacillus simplex TaxID=1478 RepID=UPI000777C89F|nr:VanZ family protein [Peribacillus simplex]
MKFFNTEVSLILAASLIYLFYLFSSGEVILNIVLNWLFILIVSLWIVRKTQRGGIFLKSLLFFFILYLHLLHNVVTYINFDHFFTQKYVGDFFIDITKINFIPFDTISNNLFGATVAPVTIVQTVGNLILLTPLTFCLLTFKLSKNGFVAMYITFFTSLFIESFQFLQNYVATSFEYGEAYRSVDIDDIILNSLSGIIGVILFKIMNKKFISKLNKVPETDIPY